jgi:hypothetical protein
MFSESPGSGGEQGLTDRVPGPEAATPLTRIGDNGRANGGSELHRVWGITSSETDREVCSDACDV